jgi:hypothetical protein
VELGLFMDGKMILGIGKSQEAMPFMMRFMDGLAARLDDEYQKMKNRDGIFDASYIAFDYCK